MEKGAKTYRNSVSKHCWLPDFIKIERDETVLGKILFFFRGASETEIKSTLSAVPSVFRRLFPDHFLFLFLNQLRFNTWHIYFHPPACLSCLSHVNQLLLKATDAAGKFYFIFFPPTVKLPQVEGKKKVLVKELKTE